MPVFHSDNLSPDPNRDDSLKGRAFSGAQRLTIDGLDPGSSEYAKVLVSLCLLIHARKLVILSPSTRAAVEQFDLFEWSSQYPREIIQRQLPYFPGDKGSHEAVARLEADYVRIRRAQDRGDLLDRRYVPKQLHTNTPWNYHMVLNRVEREIESILQELSRGVARGINVPEGRIRLTDFGEGVVELIHGKPIDIGAQVIRVLLRAEEASGKASRRAMVDHIAELWKVASETQPTKALRLQAFERHVRKLGVALIEGSLPFDRNDLQIRARQILAEGHVDTILSESRTRAQQTRHGQAYDWLQGFNLGQYCPTPFPSWQPVAKKESFEESFKIVMRARHHSYHTFGRLRMENRSLGGQLPLFREFAMDTFEDVRFVRGDNIDKPPGRGTYMSGAQLNKMFFSLSGQDDVLRDYVGNSELWFADQLRALEQSTVIALRQWIGVTSPTSNFTTMNDRYYYIIDNDHFSGSYGFAYGIPVSVISSKLRQAMYGMDQGPQHATDVGALKASIPDLIEATRKAGKLPLTLGHMSPLFGGMCNALPVGSAPVFEWEEKRQGAAWRDVYGHVHWSWLVWGYRDDRATVEASVRPLSAADWSIRNFAISGQKLFEAFRHRYGAWKNDQTPGERAAPRMLVRAYDIYHEHQRKGAAVEGEEPIYIALVDRTKPTFNPIPIINCHTLELSTKMAKIQLPTRSDGMENQEINLWKRHVQPMIQFSTKDEIGYEGPYELAIVGENDIKRS